MDIAIKCVCSGINVTDEIHAGRLGVCYNCKRVLEVPRDGVRIPSVAPVAPGATFAEEPEEQPRPVAAYPHSLEEVVPTAAEEPFEPQPASADEWLAEVSAAGQEEAEPGGEEAALLEGPPHPEAVLEVLESATLPAGPEQPPTEAREEEAPSDEELAAEVAAEPGEAATPRERRMRRSRRVHGPPVVRESAETKARAGRKTAVKEAKETPAPQRPPGGFAKLLFTVVLALAVALVVFSALTWKGILPDVLKIKPKLDAVLRPTAGQVDKDGENLQKPQEVKTRRRRRTVAEQPATATASTATSVTVTTPAVTAAQSATTPKADDTPKP